MKEKLNNKTVIRTENGWHIDQNNNRWNADYYTAEQAEVFSTTLINCSDCSDCRDCSSCSYCSDCRDCSSCSSCSSCRYCSYCRYCSSCRYCSYCRDCSDCSSCSSCSSCSYCSYCRDCSDCSSCSSCSSCSYCRYCRENPQRIFGWKMGSRNDIPAVYWLEPGKEQCVVGCFRGTLDQLEAKVKETHQNNPEHLKNYLKFIRNVRAYQEACKDDK